MFWSLLIYFRISACMNLALPRQLEREALLHFELGTKSSGESSSIVGKLSLVSLLYNTVNYIVKPAVQLLVMMIALVCRLNNGWHCLTQKQIQKNGQPREDKAPKIPREGAEVNAHRAW